MSTLIPALPTRPENLALRQIATRATNTNPTIPTIMTSLLPILHTPKKKRGRGSFAGPALEVPGYLLLAIAEYTYPMGPYRENTFRESINLGACSVE